jgi:hypothetical protein
VEAGGIYHCPNPFCFGCGATWWKTHNLKVQDNKILNSKEWLTKGLDEINKMSYELGNKIMALKHTKKVIKELNGKED